MPIDQITRHGHKLPFLQGRIQGAYFFKNGLTEFVFLLHPGDSQHGAAGAVAEGDVWVGLSKGGETAEVIFLAGIARKRGATVVAITEKPASSLGRLADIVLRVTAPEGIDPFGMVATGSSLPIRIRPSSTKSAPSPSAQKPKASSWRMISKEKGS